MAAANLKTELLDTLKQEVAGEGLDGGEQIFLTPYLALACSLLYMMAVDGELEEQESSQLQAVLGGDQAVLSYALRYVQSVPVEQFFTTASELLSVKDKWCILTNVCDALLADGHADRTELALFAKMSSAFGVRESQFEPYFKILALKNDKSILGKYAGVRDERQPMTPHFALAIALLYMLTSDGSIGAQEVGQLEAVIGEFEGLQNVALRYVRSVKLKQFLDEASVLLKPEQKLYILTNVCDSMLSDGEVAHLEDKLFLSMLTAFGFTEKTFARYHQVLETKNFKPFDTSAFKNHVSHERLTGNEEETGITFKHQLTDVKGTAVNDFPDAANQGVWVGATGNAEMSQFIARTMEENIQSVSDDFQNQDNVVKVGLNATDGLNLQKLDDGRDAQNRPSIDAAAAIENLQKIDTSTQDVNRQTIEANESGLNRQSMEVGGLSANLQTFDVDAQGAHCESLPPEVRLQNIHEVAEEVNHRLDRFETAHFRFLQIGRTQKFTDAFVPIENDAQDVNRQLLDASSERMGIDFSSSSIVASLGSDVAAAADDVVSVELGATSGSLAPTCAQDDVLAAQVSTSEGTPASKDAPQKQVRSGMAGWWTYRGRGFVYVQLLVASFALVFAAPIETRSVLRRSVVGPLLMLPVTVPASIDLSMSLELDTPLTSKDSGP